MSCIFNNSWRWSLSSNPRAARRRSDGYGAAHTGAPAAPPPHSPHTTSAPPPTAATAAPSTAPAPAGRPTPRAAAYRSLSPPHQTRRAGCPPSWEGHRHVTRVAGSGGRGPHSFRPAHAMAAGRWSSPARPADVTRLDGAPRCSRCDGSLLVLFGGTSYGRSNAKRMEAPSSCLRASDITVWPSAASLETKYSHCKASSPALHRVRESQ